MSFPLLPELFNYIMKYLPYGQVRQLQLTCRAWYRFLFCLRARQDRVMYYGMVQEPSELVGFRIVQVNPGKASRPFIIRDPINDISPFRLLDLMWRIMGPLPDYMVSKLPLKEQREFITDCLFSTQKSNIDSFSRAKIHFYYLWMKSYHHDRRMYSYLLYRYLAEQGLMYQRSQE